MSASAAPRETAVVLLPTPPFWLAIAMTRVRRAAALGAPEVAFGLGAEEETGDAEEAEAGSLTAGS